MKRIHGRKSNITLNQRFGKLVLQNSLHRFSDHVFDCDDQHLVLVQLECARGAGPAEGVLSYRSDLGPYGILHRNWKKRPEIRKLQSTPKMM